MRIDQKEDERKNFRRRGAAVLEALPLTLQSAKNGSSSSKLSKYSLAFQGLSSFLSITSRGAVTPPRSPLSFQIYTPPSTARVFVLLGRWGRRSAGVRDTAAYLGTRPRPPGLMSGLALSAPSCREPPRHQAI